MLGRGTTDKSIATLCWSISTMTTQAYTNGSAQLSFDEQFYGSQEKAWETGICSWLKDATHFLTGICCCFYCNTLPTILKKGRVNICELSPLSLAKLLWIIFMSTILVVFVLLITGNEKALSILVPLFFIGLFLCFGLIVYLLRGQIRRDQHIAGSETSDLFCSFCCMCCSVHQLAHQVDMNPRHTWHVHPFRSDLEGGEGVVKAIGKSMLSRCDFDYLPPEAGEELLVSVVGDEKIPVEKNRRLSPESDPFPL